MTFLIVTKLKSVDEFRLELSPCYLLYSYYTYVRMRHIIRFIKSLFTSHVEYFSSDADMPLETLHVRVRDDISRFLKSFFGQQQTRAQENASTLSA